MARWLLSARLRSPVSLALDFDNRPYRLGDTIPVTVQLHARRDVRVLEGRVELVCQDESLAIQPGTPPHARDGSLKWTLAAAVGLNGGAEVRAATRLAVLLE